MYAHAPYRSLLAVVFLAGLAGCGTDFNQALLQAAGATGRSFIDSLLTDFVNTTAESFDRDDTPDQEDEADDGGTPPPVGPPLEELTGEPDAGEGIFTSNGCTACHCPGAGGGCALNAPSIVGVATETLDDRLRGDVDHPGGKFDFTNQVIVDLQAYLASLGGGTG